VFDKHKEKKAEEDFVRHFAEWQQAHDEAAQLIETAQTYTGDTTSDKLILKADEKLFATVSGVGLVEERRGPGQWQGHSQGFSVPVGSVGGHQVHYRVGQTRGHYVQGTPTPTSIDSGTLFITDRRVVFEGAHQTRECAFAKLIGVDYGAEGSATFSVSNRQKATILHYGPSIAGWVHFRVELALAHFRGAVPELVAQLRQQLADLDQSKPVVPAVTG
jgi:hypothetical protein